MERILICTNVCFATIKEYSPIYCSDYKTVTDKIISIAGEFDAVFLVNDCHKKEDIEFRFLPEHCVELSGTESRIPFFEKAISAKTEFYFLRKTVLSAVRSSHNLQTMMGFEPKKIYLSGFCCSFDILATAFDLLQLGKNVLVLPECVGDLTKEHKAGALKQIEWMGIPLSQI